MFKIRTERMERGWTQSYVAKEVGIVQPALQMIETGTRKPSYDVLVKLEDLFGLTHRELFAEAPGDLAR